MPEPTSEKPRPSLDDTLRNIDNALAEPPDWLGKPLIRLPETGAWVVETTNPPTPGGGIVPPVFETSVVDQPPERHLSGPPGPTCPGCAADAARPGWLARVLSRLFG